MRGPDGRDWDKVAAVIEGRPVFPALRYLIRIVDVDLFTLSPEARGLLATWDVNGHDGLGSFTITENPWEALGWPSLDIAREAYREQSHVKPMRADGKPNRPMTVFTVRFEWAYYLRSGVVMGAAE